MRDYGPWWGEAIDSCWELRRRGRRRADIEAEKVFHIVGNKTPPSTTPLKQIILKKEFRFLHVHMPHFDDLVHRPCPGGHQHTKV